MTLWLTLALLTGCVNQDKDVRADTGEVDSADTQDTDPQPACTAEVLTISPEDADVEVYYRDSLEVSFSEDGGLAEFRLEVVDTGEEAPSTVTWDEDNLKAVIAPDTPLQSSSVYQFTVTICEAEWASGFTTTEYGAPLTVDPADMIGTTSVLLFTQVDFVEPPGIGMLLGQYLDIPLLVGVADASATQLDLLIGQGYFDSVVGFKQRMNLPTWSFDGVDFTQQPYFHVTSPEVVIHYSGIELPVTDFSLKGTFSADGTHFAGGELSGLGDTRNMGELFIGGSNDDAYVCETLGAPMGVECEACPDGSPYCLFLRGVNITTQAQPGLTLTAIAED